MRRNNKIIIIVSIIVALAVVGAVMAYLFIATDVFKSSKELFAKYFMQEIKTIENVIDLESVETYKTLNYMDKFENETNIKLIHSEGGEVSNPLNDLSAKLHVQKDIEQEYFYADAQILYKDESYFGVEFIKEENSYGVGFPDVFQQFVTIEQDENMETIVNELGIDVSQLETVINIIDGNQSIISEEQSEIINTKYSNIANIILKGTFEKQKNAMITYNNVTTKTNAYSVSLTNEQVKQILLEISEDIDEELETPTAKITVYVERQVPIRTIVEIEEHKITIENNTLNGEIITKIAYSHLSDEETLGIEAEIKKASTENEETFEIVANVTEGEENSTISLSNKMQSIDGELKINTEISAVQDITTISLVLENELNIGKEFEKLKTLTEENYRSLSSIQDSAKRKQIIETLEGMVSQTFTERVGLLMIVFMGQGETTENPNSEPEISQLEINNFNAKFEFYTGEDISAENVKMLLDIVKNHLANYEITENNIKLSIEKDVANEEAIDKVLEKINDNAKYKISISYKESNGMIDNIIITEM